MTKQYSQVLYCGVAYATKQQDSIGNPLDFHHDNAQNKGKVAVAFTPEVSQCGCFRLFEWHPGSDGDDCSTYLPTRAPIEITDGNGTTHRGYVDQSRNGKRWNSLGCYDLNAGEQHIVASNEGTDDCSQNTCYWIADAFKLEYVAQDCAQMPSCAKENKRFLKPPKPEATGAAETAGDWLDGASAHAVAKWRNAFIGSSSAA